MKKSINFPEIGTQVKGSSLEKVRPLNKVKYNKAKQVEDFYKKQFDEMEVPTREELGMNRGNCDSWRLYAICLSIFFGIIASMIMFTDKVIEMCK